MLHVPRFALSYVDAYGAAIFAIALALARFVELSANFFVAFSNDFMTILFILILFFLVIFYICVLWFFRNIIKKIKKLQKLS
jgi:hypothetical protein